MNANELANELERPNNYQQENNFTTQAAIMLRQQQAEIENLNRRIERMIEKQSHYEAMAHAGGFEAGRELGMKQERERNNEPVAWFEQDPDMKSVWYQADQDSPNAIPLYTHPVKELTDEEIIDCVNKEFDLELKDGNATVLAFARAILRKASEK